MIRETTFSTEQLRPPLRLVPSDAPPALPTRRGRVTALATRLLPPARQRDLAAVIRLWRWIDEVARDDPAALGRIETAITRRTERHGLIAAYLAAERRWELDPRWVRRMIGAYRSESAAVRIADDRELVAHACAVAGTIGRMCCAVLGGGQEAGVRSVDLGIGARIVALCGSVAADARRDRVYLPASRLARCGVRSEDLVRERRFGDEVVPGVLDLADAYLDRAREGIPLLPLRGRPVAWAAVERSRRASALLRVRCEIASRLRS